MSKGINHRWGYRLNPINDNNSFKKLIQLKGVAETNSDLINSSNLHNQSLNNHID